MTNAIIKTLWDSRLWHGPAPKVILLLAVVNIAVLRWKSSMVELMSTAPAKASEWSKETGIDLCSADGVGKLLLTYALATNPTGVVLCGMHQVEHIARNAAVASVDPPAQTAFQRVVRDIREALVERTCSN